MQKEINKILVIGSGPIIIGQAAEFDYAGTQACQALKEEGKEVILINSNPATIMTDKDTADKVYIEPLTYDFVLRIIELERPDGIIGTIGGQTGLNLLLELDSKGILEKYNVEILGSSVDAIRKSEDRELFKDFMKSIDEPTPKSFAVKTVSDAKKAADKIGYPVIVRPAYTLGGTGGGVADNEEELLQISESGLKNSPVNQVLIETSLLGWKEVEYEIVRDKSGNTIAICNMENFDPVGVHTGDSIVVAPSQTLNNNDYQTLRTSAINIIDSVGIVGACNVQFAYRPKHVSGDLESDYYVIEINPRVSRSSALASKATGYPIARVAAKISVGLDLKEIKNRVTGTTTAAFEPALDYCVVKIPRWPFDKFPEADRSIGTQMKATGEVMAIERSFEAALQKALRSLEYEKPSLGWEDPSWTYDEMLQLKPDDHRLWKIAKLLRSGCSVRSISEITKIDDWFLECIKRITEFEKNLREEELDYEVLYQAKQMGFSDLRIAELVGRSENQIRKSRLKLGIKPVYKMVDTCAGEFKAETAYFYSTYEIENECPPIKEKKVIVLGSGPIRIGQGIEFDYASVHALKTFKKMGYEGIMINSNPETVSTDFDVSSRLYFEPLDTESVLDIVENEKIKTQTPEVVVQFGGQTAINLVNPLSDAGVKIFGTELDSIHNVSDRGIFRSKLEKCGIEFPPGRVIDDKRGAGAVAKKIGYPVMIRPSYVLGGRAMAIVHNEAGLSEYIDKAIYSSNSQTILLDKYIDGIELDVDAVSDGQGIFIPGIMTHIEKTGVHSGDSMLFYPNKDLKKHIKEKVVLYTKEMAKVFKLTGIFNMQFVIEEGTEDVYVLEINPRSSRTTPFVSKATDIPLISLAIRCMSGEKIPALGFEYGLLPDTEYFSAKAPVFSNAKLPGVDNSLMPEMKSTGEVMCFGNTKEMALGNALIASGNLRPKNKNVFISLADKDQNDRLVQIAKMVKEMGGLIYATPGTARYIKNAGIDVEVVGKIKSVTNLTTIDILEEKLVGMVINTLEGDFQSERDAVTMRTTAIIYKVVCFTSLDTAELALSLYKDQTM